MKATNSIDLNVNRDAEATSIPSTSDFQEISMRRTLVAVRDTLLILGMQIVFRAMMLLRHLNY